MLRCGYRMPFISVPPLSTRPISFDSCTLASIRGCALEEELSALVQKGAVEPANQSPGYYSWMFVVQKA